MLSWLIPALLGLVGTGIGAGVSAANAKQQARLQENLQKQQLKAQEDAANNQRTLASYQEQQNNRIASNAYAQSMNDKINTNIASGTITGMGIQGLNGQQGYLQEEDETAYAKCGGRFKRLLGGKNKVERASIFVSPNNTTVRTDIDTDKVYRDRLAQLKNGGRYC